MSRNIFVTGTGTDIGKTYVCGLIVKKLHESGYNAGYFKAAVSGNIRDEQGSLIPGDAKFVRDISGISQPLEDMCPYVYETAVSPHLASRIEGNAVDTNVVKSAFEKVCGEYDFVTVEGSGGIICPICFDNGEVYLPDIIKMLDLSCIMVADAGLGTINNVVLTYEYMRSHNIPVKGVIYNNYHKGDIMQEDNIYMCEHLTGLKTLAKVPCNADMLDIDVKDLLDIYI